MTQFEEALVDDCVTKCAFEIYKSMRLFRNHSDAQKSVIKNEILETIPRYLKELENANRD